MLKSAFRLLVSSHRTLKPTSKIQSLLYTSVRPFTYTDNYIHSGNAVIPRPDTSTQAVASAIIIYNALKYSPNFTELFMCIDKYAQFVNTNHVFIMTKRFHDLLEPNTHNPLIEHNYCNIVRMILQKFDNQSEDFDVNALMRIYYYVSVIPYSNSVTKRCKFVLEQKGFSAVDGADPMEFPRFLSTLIKNGQTFYAKALLPKFMEKIDKVKLGRLIHTSYDIAAAGIATPEFLKAFAQLIKKNNYIDRLRVFELSLVLFVYIKYESVIGRPEIFSNFEQRVFAIESYYDMNSLKSLFEVLTHSNRAIFTKKVFRQFEKLLITSSTEMSDDLLVLILQNESKLLFESVRFWQKLVLEAFERSNRLQPDVLVEVLSQFTQNNGYFANVLEKFTEVVKKDGISSLKCTEFETLITTLYQFDTASLIKPSQELRKLCADHITAKADTFSVQQLESILEKRSFFAREDQEKIVECVQRRIMEGNGFSKDNLHLKTICHITNICLTEFQNAAQQKFVNSIIDLSMALLLENVKEEALNIPNSLEVYGVFLSVVSQQNLDKIYTEKRKKLFQIFEQHLIKLKQHNEPPIAEQPLVEDYLSKYVDALYSILERSDEDIEKVHENARTAYGLV